MDQHSTEDYANAFPSSSWLLPFIIHRRALMCQVVTLRGRTMNCASHFREANKGDERHQALTRSNIKDVPDANETGPTAYSSSTTQHKTASDLSHCARAIIGRGAVFAMSEGGRASLPARDPSMLDQRERFGVPDVAGLRTLGWSCGAALPSSDGCVMER
ncbi:MAG: hypothetical protein QOD00_1015 [Blastocatellia bacterium]|jgi:hypothetical protein|nr:hypothetical protein [Blastocatellia bacterium]